MSNHCWNSLTITNITQDQWRDLAATFQVRGEGDRHEFLKTFYPEPDWQKTQNENGELPSAPDDNGITHFKDGQQDLRWYEWRNQHWGTKWDAYSCSNDWENEVPSDEFNANFYTAWAPLSKECMAVLSENLPGSLLVNHYEESEMDFYGVTVAKNGIAEDICQTSSEYLEPFLRQQFPDLDARLEEEGLDLEDNLDDFFWENCDSCEFCEFIYDTQESLVEKMIQEIEGATTEFLIPA